MTRIIAGEWRSHPLPKLTGGAVRPTTDRARTVLFDTLRNLRDLEVLDLFSGTGGLGFEALSRGASSLVSIDIDREYIQLQKQWIMTHPKPFQAYAGDVAHVLQRLTDQFDLILADPPYQETMDQELIALIEAHAKPGARFVYERNRRDMEPITSARFILEKEKVVAQTRIQIYKASEL